jgi:hypothetical protein
MEAMQRIYSARHPADAQMLKDLLAAEGIDTLIRGGDLFGARGGAPLTPDTLPSVWVVKDEDFERAMTFVGRYARREPLHDWPAGKWRCWRCGEILEGQFTDCWKCGASRAK